MDDWQTLVRKGIALIRDRKPKAALKKLKLAERQAPSERDVRYWLANAYRMTGDQPRSRRLFKMLLKARPGDLEASFGLAFLLRDSGEPAAAATVLSQAAEQPTIDTDQLLQITAFLRDMNQHKAALEVCTNAAERCPERADIHFKLARLQQALGDFDACADALERTLQLQASIGPAWIMLAQQRQFATESDEMFGRLAQAASRPLGDEADMCVSFAYGKALDDLGRYREAWEQLSKGNAIMARRRPWNPSAWRTFVERKLQTPVAATEIDATSARNAVFVVGMLRSGTTLLEQRLARYPGVYGRGELNFLAHFAAEDGDRRQHGDEIWTQLRLDGPADGTYIDKNPLNFRFLDAAFEMLPSARVLHVTRDGRDSCLSCFSQLFEHADTGFANDLESLTEHYAGYRRLMLHWERLFPERILRVAYEDLVGDTEAVLEQVLDFLGVDAEAAKEPNESVVRTASVWQARQPVHSRSLGRWRHYYEQAPGFFDRLAEIDTDAG